MSQSRKFSRFRRSSKELNRQDARIAKRRQEVNEKNPEKQAFLSLPPLGAPGVLAVQFFDFL
jgi:hypothetical protein